MLRQVAKNSFRRQTFPSLCFSPCPWNNCYLLCEVAKFFSKALNSVESPSEPLPEKKILKVAILGKPNAGKSTLINKILQANVCDVSSKVHTTRFAVKTAFVSGNTQIIIVDTPGLVSKKEISRFNLSESFVEWKKNIFEEVDAIGLIHEIPIMNQPLNVYQNLFGLFDELHTSKPIFLIFNKIDKIKNKDYLLKLIKMFTNEYVPQNGDTEKPNSFTKLFFISALKNIGVNDVVQYLLDEAKTGDWILNENQICDTPINILVENLLRAKILNLLPQEVPYICDYEIEYLEENSMGEFVCVALIVCKRLGHLKMLVKKHQNELKSICQEIESDLYNILKKTFRLRVVVITKNK